MEWLPIKLPGFDHYEVTRDGQVRNGVTQKLLRPYSGYGKIRNYRKVRLYGQRGLITQQFVHRLVAITFLEVDHKDGNPMNNNLDNLEWVTPFENLKRRRF